MRKLLFVCLVIFALLAILQMDLPASPAPLRIMPVGDSITEGWPVPGGYRAPLYHLLTDAGYNVDFVGTLTNNSSSDLPDPDHEGHYGWRIDHIDGIIDTSLAAVDDPDVILLLIGTNDYSQNSQLANIVQRIESLIEKIATNRPYAKVILANLLVRDEPYNTEIETTFNPYLPGIAQRQQAMGRDVFYDDIRSAVPLEDLPDQLHPDATGYAKMATNWFGVITNLFDPEGSKSAPAIARVLGSGLASVKVIFSKPIADESAIPGNFSLGGGLSITHAALDQINKREVTLTTTLQQPLTTYSVTVNSVHDRTAAQLEISSNSIAFFSSQEGPPASSKVAEAANYQLVYSLNIPDMPNYEDGLTYNMDHHAGVSEFSRIAYYLELEQTNGISNFVWVSMDAFTDNVNLIGVPTVASGAFFQQPITSMNVQSSVPEIVVGTNLSGGNIEFWPQDYSMNNTALVPNASDGVYDWGDSPYPGNYGSMQVHNHDAGQVIFAFNRWGGYGGKADIGIGNYPSGEPDWTFAGNASSYAIKTLQVFVLPVPSIKQAYFAAPSQFSINWDARPGAGYSVFKKPALDTSVWTRIGGLTATSNIAVFIDFDVTNRAGFYRVSSP
jgi:lysophospholipase L1-like esterase